MRKNIILVIGSVTARQYQPIRVNLLRKLIRPQVVRIEWDKLSISEGELIARGLQVVSLVHNPAAAAYQYTEILYDVLDADPFKVHYVVVSASEFMQDVRKLGILSGLFRVKNPPILQIVGSS